MDRLLRASPVVDKTAVSNSSSSLDLSILECRSPSFDVVSIFLHCIFHISTDSSQSQIDPLLLEEDMSNHILAAAASTVPASPGHSVTLSRAPSEIDAPTATAPTNTTAPTTSTPAKRKFGLVDRMIELHEQDRRTRLETVDRFMDEKREQAEAKRQTQLEIMRMRLESKEKEKEREREFERERMAHEKEIIKMKVELAKVQCKATSAD